MIKPRPQLDFFHKGECLDGDAIHLMKINLGPSKNQSSLVHLPDCMFIKSEEQYQVT